MGLHYSSGPGGVTVSATGGQSDGCASGAAGTILMSLNSTVRVDNGDPLTVSALTPFPKLPSASEGWTVAVMGGCSLEFPPSPLRRVLVSDASLLATSASSTLNASSVAVSAGGTIGCIPCPLAIDAQNLLPGCAAKGTPSTCPPVRVHSTGLLSLLPGARLLALHLNLSSTLAVEVAEGGLLSSPDQSVESVLGVASPLLRVAGKVRFSTAELRGDAVYVGPTGHISGDALGHAQGLGLGPGMAGNIGGGGGGGGGNGAQGCSLYSLGGSCNGTQDASRPWVLGSGGGRGGGNAPQVGGRGGGRVGVWVTGKLSVHGVVSVDGGGTRCFGLVRSKYTGNRVRTYIYIYYIPNTCNEVSLPPLYISICMSSI